jgi:hypothetical protein
MPGQEDIDHAARLEAALDRIAKAAPRAAAHPTLRPSPEQTTSAPPRAHEIAARLDGVIAALRGVLGTET